MPDEEDPGIARLTELWSELRAVHGGDTRCLHAVRPCEECRDLIEEICALVGDGARELW